MIVRHLDQKPNNQLIKNIFVELSMFYQVDKINLTNFIKYYVRLLHQVPEELPLKNYFETHHKR